MHQLERRYAGTDCAELFADIILNRLDVMVDARLDEFHCEGGTGIGRLREVLRAFANRGAQACPGKLRQRAGEV